MTHGGSNIVCPGCKKKTAAPLARDGASFTCAVCDARLRWRLRGTQALLELISGPSVQSPPPIVPAVQKQASVVKSGGSKTVIRPPNTAQIVHTGKSPGLNLRYTAYSACGIALVATLVVCVSLLLRNSNPPQPKIDIAEDVPPDVETTVESEVPPVLRTRAELIAAFEPSVCKVLTPESSGTGFLVAPNLIATNKHVVGCWDTKYLKGEFLNSSTSLSAGTEAAWEIRNLKLAYATDDFDLCFLRAESVPPSCQPIPPANMDRLARGQEVIIIGCPYGQEGTITPGVLNQLRNDIDTKPLLSISAAVNPGNSGGPVITLFGESAGVVVLKHGQADGLGYAVPASAVSESLQNLATQTPSQIEQNTSRFKCKQSATAILLCTLETGALLSPEHATRSSEESIARITFLLSNTQGLIESVKSSGANQSAADLLSDALSQIERVFTNVKSGSGNGLVGDIEVLGKLNERLKLEIGYLEFELP